MQQIARKTAPNWKTKKILKKNITLFKINDVVLFSKIATIIIHQEWHWWRAWHLAGHWATQEACGLQPNQAGPDQIVPRTPNCTTNQQCTRAGHQIWWTDCCWLSLESTQLRAWQCLPSPRITCWGLWSTLPLAQQPTQPMAGRLASDRGRIFRSGTPSGGPSRVHVETMPRNLTQNIKKHSWRPYQTN